MDARIRREPDEMPPLLALLWPALLLLCEATALTPWVEFSGGPMTWFAQPLLLSVVIFSLSLVMLLLLFAAQSTGVPEGAETIASNGALDAASQSPAAIAAQTTTSPSGASHWLLRPWRNVRLRWLLAHGATLAIFAVLTLLLHQNKGGGATAWLAAAAWMLLAIFLALSLALAFHPRKKWFALAHQIAPQAIAAIILGIAFGLLIEPARNFWTSVDDPLLAALRAMLAVYPGPPVLEGTSGRWPIVGTPQMALIVTPACSELESLLAFLLLGSTLSVANWQRFSPWKLCCLLAAGLATLYLLLLLRLYFMILIGLWSGDAYTAVNLAHSRVSTFLFSICSLAMLYFGAQFCGREPWLPAYIVEAEEVPDDLAEESEQEELQFAEPALEAAASSIDDDGLA